MVDTASKVGVEENRVFLCVIDDTAEMHKALRFASRRAVRKNGQVALLYVVEPADFQHWMSVEKLMREEGLERAKEKLREVSREAMALTGTEPITYIREGTRSDELLKLIEEEKDISVLVLGAGTGKEGPGPLVSSFIDKMSSGEFRIPVTIVPGSLQDEDIDAIT
ncbi:MAG: universal stress protein [Rhodospirillales bacterium]